MVEGLRLKSRTFKTLQSRVGTAGLAPWDCLMANVARFETFHILPHLWIAQKGTQDVKLKRFVVPINNDDHTMVIPVCAIDPETVCNWLDGCNASTLEKEAITIEYHLKAIGGGTLYAESDRERSSKRSIPAFYELPWQLAMPCKKELTVDGHIPNVAAPLAQSLEAKDTNFMWSLYTLLGLREAEQCLWLCLRRRRSAMRCNPWKLYRHPKPAVENNSKREGHTFYFRSLHGQGMLWWRRPLILWELRGG